MDFFKKIFGGKSDEKQGGEAGGAPQGVPPQNGPAGAGGSQATADGEEKKADHNQGHPSGQGGKNVCEFC